MNDTASALRRAAPTLSKREKQVIALLASGERTAEIGKTLGISVKTASTYKTRISQKLGHWRQPGDAALVLFARQHGLI